MYIKIYIIYLNHTTTIAISVAITIAHCIAIIVYRFSVHISIQ